MESSPLLSGATSPLLGGDAGDVRYPYYLINGRIRTAPRTFTGRPGQRVRIRFINAGADTAFRVALGGHTMTITHTDGFPVTPMPAAALLIGMGERYDVQVTLGDGMFPLVALAEGKNSTALALVSTGMGTPPAPDVLPRELYSPVTTSYTLKPTATAALSARQPDVTYKLQLTGGMARYNWGINGQSFDMAQPGGLRYLMKQGQRVRVIFANTTTMYHPMHIHGHTFQVAPGGPRKEHRPRAAAAAGGLRRRRRQPRAVDDALPQPLPFPRRRHDGRARLSDLTPQTDDGVQLGAVRLSSGPSCAWQPHRGHLYDAGMQRSMATPAARAAWGTINHHRPVSRHGIC